jgi:ubiquinone/menaquinone biosynthesis C-methylase UbiE
VARFPDPESVARLMDSTGFANTRFEPWMGGTVSLHTAQR